MGVVMKRWKITYVGGATNIAIGDADIWTGRQGVSLVEDQGNDIQILPPVLPALPAILSSTAFQDVTETALGGGSTGRTRFGEIIRAMSSSVDNEVLAVSKRYDKSLTFERAKVSALLTLLVSKGIVQGSERSAVLAAWPT